MKRIIRLTESDLARIVRRVISEGFGQNQNLTFESVTGYKSGLFPQLIYYDNGPNWHFGFAGSKTLASALGLNAMGFQSVVGETDPTGRDVAWIAGPPKTAKTRAEIEAALKNPNMSNCTSVPGKNPFTVKAGGTYKDKAGKTVTWGRPGFTAGSEMTDAICKILNIV
jgi:hypothetical protein